MIYSTTSQKAKAPHLLFNNDNIITKTNQPIKAGKINLGSCGGRSKDYWNIDSTFRAKFISPERGMVFEGVKTCVSVLASMRDDINVFSSACRTSCHPDHMRGERKIFCFLEWAYFNK